MTSQDAPAKGQVVHQCYPDRYRVDVWIPGWRRGQWRELALTSADLATAKHRAAMAADAHKSETRVRDTRPTPEGEPK